MKNDLKISKPIVTFESANGRTKEELLEEARLRNMPKVLREEEQEKEE